MAEMTTGSINDLPDSAFAYIEPGGKKDSGGKTVPRSLRHFPVHDAAHTRNALARAPQSPFGKKAMPKILSAAKKFGIEVSDSSSRALELPAFRTIQAEDIRVRTEANGERMVEAYAAVFDRPYEIHDPDGDYVEVIDHSCFNRALEHARSSGRSFPVLYNHGLTMHGTPDPDGNIPIGVAEEVSSDRRGLFTRTRFAASERARNILECIEQGSITGYSFSGIFKQSDPPRRGSTRYRGQTVRRMESTLREFGPALFPANPGADIIGVRSLELAMLLDQLPFGTSSPEDPAIADTDPPRVHSARSNREQMRAAYAAFLSRQGAPLP